ncbi:MAG: tetratricopeptide repeat protein, partial [Akkermansiaceae bacterium]|nr:tetratricopeptide repeat protein [Akkermansiaceae bacterium]
SGCNKEAKAAGKLSSAKEYFAKGDYAAAEIEFKNVLSAKPGDPEALKGMGLILVGQGAMFDAGRMLAAAKRQFPKDDEVGTALAQALFELGFIGDSRKELVEVLDRTPAYGEALLLFAETSLTPETMTECEERIAKAESPDAPHVLLASALIELRRSKFDDGAKLIDRAIAADPKFTRALALQGTLFAMRKQPEKAVESLKKAADLAGARSAETIAYARLLMGQERKDDAVTLLKQATGAAPDYLPCWRLLAQIAVSSKDDAGAAGYLTKVLEKSPLDIDAGVLQSQIWLRQKEPAKAVALLEKITKIFQSRPALELNLGKAYLAAGDFVMGTATLDRVLKLSPTATEAILLRAGLHLQAGEPAEAIRRLEPLDAAEPANRMAQDLLVQAYRATNRGDEAAAILQQQGTAAPEDPAVQVRLGQVLVSQGKLTEARAAFEQALKLAPDELACISQLIALDQQEGKTAEAMARADAYLTAHPESAQANLLKAGLCFIQQDFKTAEALALKTIELNPQDLTAYGMLVRIQINDGRPDQAVERMQEALKTTPNNIPVRMQLSILLEQLDRTDEARASLLEMVKIAPEFAPSYNNLACLDAKDPAKLDQALENARKARSLAPKAPAIADTLGWIEWLRGSYSEALPLLMEAATELPQVATVQYHLAMAHYMMDQLPEASALLKQALALPGEFPEKSDAERRLATLRDGETLELAALEAQVKNDPKDLVLLLFQARKLAAAGRAEDAATAYQSALAINPQIAATHLALAELYTKTLNQPEKALEAATQARKIAPQSPRAAALLGTANFHLGNHREAYDLLQEAAPKLPADAGVQADFAWAAYSTGRVADARSAMDKLAQGDSSQAADARDFLALAAPNAATDAATPALVEKQLAANPACVPALMVQAALREKAGESPLASYEKVLATFPEFDPARIALARVYLDDPKQLEAAEKLATAARERLKDDPDLSGILAVINYRKGQFDYAAQLLKELSANRPLTGRELFALGMSQAGTKQLTDALKSLSQALQTELPPADAAIAKATLDKLTNPDAQE